MKNFIENIKEFRNTKYGNVILFFGFYLLFFIFIFVLIRFGGDENYYNKEYEKGRTTQFDTSFLINKNFYYDYKINLDGNSSDYYGKRFQDTELFKYNNNEYYRNGNDYYINNGNYEKVDNPYIFYELLDVDNLSNIINSSYLSSKEEVEEKKYSYKYLISTNTINKIVYNLDTDFEEVPNEIEIIIDNNSISTNVKLKLDSFCKLNEKCNDSLLIDANYEMFNSVKEIDNPVK